MFLDSLPINYTTLKLATYLEEELGNTKYHHQESGIPNTRFVLVLLDYGSRTTKRYPSISNNLSGDNNKHLLFLLRFLKINFYELVQT
jgi:hypothetical protein